MNFFLSILLFLAQCCAFFVFLVWGYVATYVLCIFFFFFYIEWGRNSEKHRLNLGFTQI